ncbi:MAG: MarR family transcriptional regulator [Roseiflexaceae bacterium]|nr:MarR family transcriptional regulator [Roseiflexaceae bacterium]
MQPFTANAHRLLQLFHAMREVKPGSAIQRLQALHLSMSHTRLMHVLAPDHSLPMKDLADALGLTPPSVTALTRRLVQNNMVQREADASDSRVVLLSLTDEGRALLRDVYQQHLADMERLLHGLTSEEQEQFLGLMERAVSALRESTTDV